MALSIKNLTKDNIYPIHYSDDHKSDKECKEDILLIHVESFFIKSQIVGNFRDKCEQEYPQQVFKFAMSIFISFDHKEDEDGKSNTTDESHYAKDGLVFRMDDEIMTVHIKPYCNCKMVNGHGYDGNPLESSSGKAVRSFFGSVFHRQRNIIILMGRDAKCLLFTVHTIKLRWYSLEDEAIIKGIYTTSQKTDGCVKRFNL